MASWSSLVSEFQNWKLPPFSFEPPMSKKMCPRMSLNAMNGSAMKSMSGKRSSKFA